MNKRDNTVFILGVFFTLSVIFISGIISFYIKIFGADIEKDTNKFAQFGDFIGGTLNPILAFLGFIALLYTIKIQSDELKATREELARSSKAQEEQSNSLKLQNKATKLQIFENTFFQLNKLWTTTRNELFISIKNEQSHSGFADGSGGSVSIIQGCIDEDISEVNIEIKSHSVIEAYLGIFKGNNYKMNYDSFNKKYEQFTGNYFGQIYQIINFIENSNIDNKQSYINIIRAQFTKKELEFLFFHCLGNIGKRKFHNLVQEYEFFEHIILNEDIEEKLLDYKIKAFGKNEKLIAKYKKLEEKK